MRIFVSGGLDEYSVDALVRENAPIDGFGVGTSLGVSEDAPTLESVFKLVVYDGRPVRKTSPGKRVWPGAKQVWRADDWSGDIVALANEAPVAGHQPLLVEVMRDGTRTAAGRADLAAANRRFDEQWVHLPARLKALDGRGEYRTEVSGRLQQLTSAMDEEPAHG